MKNVRLDLKSKDLMASFTLSAVACHAQAITACNQNNGNTLKGFFASKIVIDYCPSANLPFAASIPDLNYQSVGSRCPLPITAKEMSRTEAIEELFHRIKSLMADDLLSVTYPCPLTKNIETVTVCPHTGTLKFGNWVPFTPPPTPGGSPTPMAAPAKLAA